MSKHQTYLHNVQSITVTDPGFPDAAMFLKNCSLCQNERIGTLGDACCVCHCIKRACKIVLNLDSKGTN